MRYIGHIIVGCAVLSLLYPVNAHAYLDPGTGSFLMQLLAGVVFGGLYFLKLYWRKLKGLFGRKGEEQGE